MEEEIKKTRDNLRKLKEKYPNRCICLVEYKNTETKKVEILKFLPASSTNISDLILSVCRSINVDGSDVFLSTDGIELDDDKNIFEQIKDNKDDILICKVNLECPLKGDEKKQFGDWIKIG